VRMQRCRSCPRLTLVSTGVRYEQAECTACEARRAACPRPPAWRLFGALEGRQPAAVSGNRKVA
jgi:hypothetical protein